ncbi:DUF91 domain-containing protein [Bradyrhizobium sediminis]|uniref:DUF91 domain-containing protein n=1 Tax=Bradyrhizobium sediminis TaxID=2840469 RepID=A0A975N9E5_9BRAD|nr:endonuclease NucS domain-containing protein [Bradyrhizobium sediminis]QWG10937.1 DUF91 domain-containing protein [Bradyrhizobium sediminis]
MTEDELRDVLGTQIEILEPGLVLLEKEKYIPSKLGTRGFIDLVAQDADGHFVLIELKRSDAAAREAIHEILKYVEGVKAHLGARDHEIRVLIVSTTWRELLVPFSRFVSDSGLAVRGINLSVDFRGRLEATVVSPVSTARGRVIAPWHELNFYKSETDLQRGLREYDSSCKQKGIEDYVLVILDAPAGFNEAAKESFRLRMRSIETDFGKEPDEGHIESLVQKLDDYHSIIYFGMQLLHREACLKIIAADEDQSAEARECLPDMEEDEAICYLHETVYAVEPTPYRNGYEIGYPAKFRSRLLDQEGWKIREVSRFGVFSRNKLLTDEAIIEDLGGSEGTTRQRFKRRISINNAAHLASARTSLAECLEQNEAWKEQTLRALDEIAKQFPNSEVDVNIFNPSSCLITLFLAANDKNGVLYVPNYGLTVHDGDKVPRLYYGCLVDTGGGLSFQEVLKKYYDGKLFGLLFTLTWGGYEGRDPTILEDIGLSYRSFRCDLDGDSKHYFVWSDDAWRPTDFVNPLTSVFEFLVKRETLVADLALEIGSRWDGQMIQDESVGEHALKKLVDMKEGRSRSKFWYGDIVRCDTCGHDFENDTFMVDAATKYGAWACMCSRCFVEQEAKIGWGYGQLYSRTPEGWLLVGGFGPREDEE